MFVMSAINDLLKVIHSKHIDLFTLEINQSLE